MKKIIYSKYSNERREKYNIRTDIVKDDAGYKYIVKAATNQESMPHIENLMNWYERLTAKYSDTIFVPNKAEVCEEGVKFEFLEGDALSEILDSYISKKNLDAFYQLIEQYVSEMKNAYGKKIFEKSKEFIEIFGDVELPDGLLGDTDFNIDLIFPNIIVKDDKWNVIDYEWTFACCIPLNYVIYRALSVFVYSVDQRMEHMGDEIFQRYGITEEEVAVYRQMELNFQAYVFGDRKNLNYIDTVIGKRKITLQSMFELNRKNDQLHTVQVYLDKGTGFSETDSYFMFLEPDVDGKITLDIPLEESVVAYRIDPAQKECSIEISAFYNDVKKENEVSYNTNGYKLNNNTYLFESSDPQIYSSEVGQRVLHLEYYVADIDSHIVHNIETEIDAHNVEKMQMLEQHKNEKQELTDRYSLECAKQDRVISDLNTVIGLKDEDIRTLNNVVNDKNVHIDNLENIIEEQQEYIQKMKRAIKNPVYAAKLLYEKTKNKLEQNKKKNQQSLETEKNVQQKIEDYREKYKDLVISEEYRYENWITKLEASESYDEKFNYNPKISILVPVYNVLDRHLIPCIESVLNQVYENWELCLADDNSTWENVGQTLSKYENHEKIKIVYRKENGHISKCTNSALELATGEFVAFMDCDDLLRPNALYEVVKKLNENPELDFIYSDEDKVDDDGSNRHMPNFKPDWSPDTLMSCMYTCHFGVYRRSIVNEIGGLRTGVEGSQDYDFTLRFTERTNKIAHIDKILYHWRERQESTAVNPGAKTYILEAAKKTKMDTLERRGLKAELELVDDLYLYRVNYISQTNPLISIIIPSKDNYTILERCIRTLVSITEYKNYEIILVDNGSNDENREKCEALSKEFNINYIYEKMTFNFSRMCNIGAAAANGEYLLFLNDDIEIIGKDWLSRMIGHAELEHIGAVGAKLLYPGGDNIQHVGVLGLECGPSHAFVGSSDSSIYYFGRNRIDYNWLAVTGACLLLKKEKYDQIAGFDEEFAVAYNDVDLCFKLVEEGYYNVVCNAAVLYHHESVSRGYDYVDEAKMQRLANELKKLYTKHPMFDKKDPFYNKKLIQNGVEFSYNYALEPQELKDVRECVETGVENGSLRCSVDGLNISDTICIEGWAFIDGREDNNDLSVKILLKGNEKSFVIETDKVYRADVAQHFGEEKLLEFVGYKCEFDKEQLTEEVYRIGIMLEQNLCMTESVVCMV